MTAGMRTSCSLLVSLLVLWGCRPAQPIAFPLDADASYEPGDAVAPPSPDGDAPSAACANMRKLACPDSNGSPGGLSCEDTMRAAAAAGLDLRTACLAAASSQDEARACCSPGQACSPACR